MTSLGLAQTGPTMREFIPFLVGRTKIASPNARSRRMLTKSMFVRSMCCAAWALSAYPTLALSSQLVPFIGGRTVGQPASPILYTYWGIAWWFTSWSAVYISFATGLAAGISLGFVRPDRPHAWRWAALPLSTWCYVAVLLVAYRAWGPLLGIAAVSSHVLYATGRIRTPVVAVAWLLAAALCLLPWDVSFQNYPGTPRFIPLEMGLPGRDAMAAANRGEVMLGGCVTTGLEPQSVLVW